jgi:hypothetical protein
MRQIKAKAPPPLSRHPQNVAEAIAEAAEAQAAGLEVADEIRVPVGAVDAVIRPGPDSVFGTDDDVVSIERHKDDKKHSHHKKHEDKPKAPKAEPKVAKEPKRHEDKPKAPKAEPKVAKEPKAWKAPKRHEDKPKAPKVDKDEPLIAEPVVEEDEPSIELVRIPDYDKSMKKVELMALAEEHGVKVDEWSTKAKIVRILNKHFGK